MPIAIFEPRPFRRIVRSVGPETNPEVLAVMREMEEKFFSPEAVFGSLEVQPSPKPREGVTEPPATMPSWLQD